MVTYIQKRDGKVVEFNQIKISNAILGAMKEVWTDTVKPATLASRAASVSKAVTESIEESVVNVEQIQDTVEDKLMKKYPEVAKAYIKYRQERTRVREMNSEINKSIKNALSCSNVMNSNANVDEYSFGGRKGAAANIVQKSIALFESISKEVAEAHRNGSIYIHDLDSYPTGPHNCLFIDFPRVLSLGFETRNGDVRKPNSLSTACQQVAVISQCQSQVQVGGVASSSLDYELAPFVRISFLKHFKDGLVYADHRSKYNWEDFCEKYDAETRIKASVIAKYNIFNSYSKSAFKYAHDMLEREGLQSMQGMYHNLNTLESRGGAELPFTSINIGLDTSFEGRKISEWALKASLEGIGKHNKTPIFPICILKYKKDVNDRPGTPNYDIKKLAIKSLSRRLYPNIVNSDWSMNKADKLPSQYIMDTRLLGLDRVNIRIGNRLYNNITVEELYNKIEKIIDTYKTQRYDKDGTKIIDLRFTNTIVCIDDNNSYYKDYNIGLNERMARINYISKSGIVYGITTDSFGFEVNGEHEQYTVPKYDYDTEMASMGCRTLLGNDVNGMGYKKTGRGNVTPVTMNLVKIGIEHGICLGKRTTPDIDGFFVKLNETLKLTEKALLDRFKHICSQSYKSGIFMYVNGTIADSENSLKNGIFESLKHGTLAFGYIGIAETCFALFGKYHNEDEKVLEFAVKVVETIYNYAKDATKRNTLNFSAYATPAESASMTICRGLQKEYGKIPGVCDREYITNSHHVPVFQKVSIYDKINIEKRFTKFPSGGCITYIELESSVLNNEKAVESIIDYSMANDIPYQAINFPIDDCIDCGFSGDMSEHDCPVCGSSNISKLRRVTGYLSTDFRKFNPGKQAECRDRVKHSKYTK